MKIQRIVLIGSAGVLLVLVLGFLTTSQALAAPAAPIEISLTQPDGSTFPARQWGDEWNHGLETIEGYAILQLPDGWWVYASPLLDGALGPASLSGQPLRVGIDPPGELPLHLRPTSLVPNPYAAASLFADDRFAPEYSNLGSQPVLVLLVEYNDQPHSYSDTSFQTEFFNSSASVKSFYTDNSYASLTLTPAIESQGSSNDGVIGWISLGTTHPAADGVMTDNEMRQIAKDAVLAADPWIDYNAYDIAPNDGYLQQWELHIFVIVAGYESSYDGSNYYAVWAHNWSLDGIGAPTIDTVVIGDYSHYGAYSEAGELHGNHQATIGTLVHELGHDLSNPDLYDTDYSSEGVGQWSVMSGGSWNQVGSYAGDSPAHFDAFLKSYMGWLIPTPVSYLHNQPIGQVETGPSAYRLGSNPGGIDWNWNVTSGTGEYWLVENRQKTGYDAGLPGCGLLVWHIDESVIYDNDANTNEDHALVWLEQADGMNHLHHPTGASSGGNPGDNNDPFPGATVSNHDFNALTNPNARLYSGASSSVSLHVDSNSCGSTMQADMLYGSNRSYLPLSVKPSGTTPGAFGKLSPTLAAVNQTTGLTLDWSDSTGVSAYEYCLDNTNDGSCAGAWISTGTTSQAGLVGLVNGATYYWQVRAIGPGGTVYADGGTWWSFGVMPVIGAFNKINPSNGSPGQVMTNLLLTWGASSNFDDYEYCYDTSNNGTCNHVSGWMSTGIAQFVYISGLTPSTTYYWQVRANGPGGPVYANGGTWWSFTTGASFATISSMDFESTFPTGLWSAQDWNGATGGLYYPAQRNCRSFGGSYSGWLIGGGTNGSALICSPTTLYPDNSSAWMVYGPFSTVGASYVQVDFYTWIDTSADPSNDNLWFVAWDGTNNPYGYSYWGSGTWYIGTENLDSPFYLCGNGTTTCMGKTNVYIAFGFVSDGDGVRDYEGAYVDDIFLRKCTGTTCVASPPFYSPDATLALFDWPKLALQAMKTLLHPQPIQFPQ